MYVHVEQSNTFTLNLKLLKLNINSSTANPIFTVNPNKESLVYLDTLQRQIFFSRQS